MRRARKGTGSVGDATAAAMSAHVDVWFFCLQCDRLLCAGSFQRSRPRTPGTLLWVEKIRGTLVREGKGMVGGQRERLSSGAPQSLKSLPTTLPYCRRWRTRPCRAVSLEPWLCLFTVTTPPRCLCGLDCALGERSIGWTTGEIRSQMTRCLSCFCAEPMQLAQGVR